MTVIIETCCGCKKEFMPLGSNRGVEADYCLDCRNPKKAGAVQVHPEAQEKLTDVQDLSVTIELDREGNLVVNFYEWCPNFWHLVKSVPFLREEMK